MALAAPRLAPDTRAALAFVASLAWLCHPLATAAITYLSQRAEAMGAFLYLGVLYAFLRSLSSPRPRTWQGLALLALAAGFATKEVIATAPLLVFLVDAVLVSPGPVAALGRRRGFYAVLGLATLGLALVFVAPELFAEHSTAGLRFEGSTPLEYARTQPGVVLHYLRLALWPHPQCFDYAWPIAREGREWLPATALVALLLAVAVALCVRRSWVGLAGAAFFLILAPTSSFVPIWDPAAEHRVYLPLAAVLVLAVAGAWWLVTRFLHAPRVAPILATAAVLALAGMTVRRNQDYRTAVRLWEVTVARAPHNARARDNLGAVLLEAGRAEEAIPHLLEALRLGPPVGYNLAAGSLNLGLAYTSLLRPEDAIPCLERAVELAPLDAACHAALGRALAMRGDQVRAIASFRTALGILPGSAETHFRLGESLRVLGRFEDAMAEFQESSRLAPELPAPYAAYAETVLMKPKATPSEQQEALRLARKANEMTSSTRPEFVALCARAEAALVGSDRAGE
jgi:tetratricopeptide (TPR) repeat protein